MSLHLVRDEWVVAHADDVLGVEVTGSDKKARVVVVVRTLAPEVVLRHDEINLNRESERARYVEQLPADYHIRATELLATVTGMVAAARQAAPPPSATPTGDVRPKHRRWTVPEPHPDAQDGAALLAGLSELFMRYVWLPDTRDEKTQAAVKGRDTSVADVAAVWCLHTWCLDAADYTPYLWVRSPTPECGKSTFIDWLGALCWHPVSTNNATPAIMYRLIEKYSCALLLDDIDTAYKGVERQADIANILNSGFHRGAPVFRMEKGIDGQMTEGEFATFSPKVIGGIGRRVLLPATASRCIRINMRKATKAHLKSLAKVRDRTREAIGAEWRPRLVRWRDDHLAALRDAHPKIPGELSGRLEDMADPLLAIADECRGVWPKRIREVLSRLMGHSSETTAYSVLLLRDLDTVFRGRQVTHLRATELIAALHAMEERPWSDWNHGKGLTPVSLSRELEDFEEVRPKNVRDGPAVYKAYHADQVAKALEAYGSDVSDETTTSSESAPGVAATPATAATADSNPLPNTALDGADDHPLRTRYAPATDDVAGDEGECSGSVAGRSGVGETPTTGAKSIAQNGLQKPVADVAGVAATRGARANDDGWEAL